MRIVKRLLLGIALLAVGAVAWLALFPAGQHADRSFQAIVAKPAYAAQHPIVLFDEGHANAHTLGGNFRAFGELLRNDGYAVQTSDTPFWPAVLARAKVLVIVNASGDPRPKLFGINLKPFEKGHREAPAFRAEEIEAVRAWVQNGGSLLFVADHYPFGSSASALAAAFGVTMHCGFTEVAKQYPGQTDSSAIRFSRANGLLTDSPIANGRNASERLEVVQSFTGQSLDAREGTPILALPPSAIEYVPPPPQFKPARAGKAQGYAIEYGRGRVVVLGEAGMLAAQVDRGAKFGMNVPGLDNKQFVLNTLHWLSRLE